MPSESSDHPSKLVKPEKLTKFVLDNIACPSDKKQVKYPDEKGDGLYLLVNSAGGKYWRFNYRFAGLRKTLALGTYPEVTLVNARIALSDARKSLSAGEDPSKTRKKVKTAAKRTFRTVAEEWRATKTNCVESTRRKHSEGLELLYKSIGDIPIADLRSGDFSAAVTQIEKKSPSMAIKSRQYAASVVRYSIINNDRAEGAFIDLKDVLKPLKSSRFHSPVGPDERGKIKDIIIAVRNYKKKNFIIGSALNLLFLTFVRPIELVTMKWKDVNEKEWKFVVSKSGTDFVNHIVPLSRQSLKILADLKELTGEDEFVFSSRRTSSGHICRDSLSSTLRDLGFRGVIVPHGSRHFASTLLNEMKFSGDVIEMQLSHRDGSVRGIYNDAKWMDDRIKMMQTWANFLDAQVKKK